MKATGTMEREGKTDSDGTIILRNLNAGTYRLRFESAGTITFEREITVAAGRPVKTTAELCSGSAPAAAAEAGAGTAAGHAASAARPTVGTTQLRVDSGLRREELTSAEGRRRRTSPVGCTGDVDGHAGPAARTRSPNTPMPKPTK